MSIESMLASESGVKVSAPVLQVSEDVAKNLQVYRSPQCANETLFQSTQRSCDSYANTANLTTLENRLRTAKNCQQYLDQRTQFNENMAGLLMRDVQCIAAIANRYGRRTQLMVSMPAIYQSYRNGCKKYDEARAATLNQENSAKVAGLVEQGLIDANKAIDTTQSTLKNAGEAPFPM